MTTNIVWATDGSAHADRAFEHAQQLAKRDAATLHVVHVIERFVTRAGAFDSHVDEREIEDRIRAQSDAAAEAGLDVRLHVSSAPAGETAARIAKVARDVEADLIVIGTRGHSAIVNALIGGVTQRLLHLSPCPVLAIPPARRSLSIAEPGTPATVAG